MKQLLTIAFIFVFGVTWSGENKFISTSGEKKLSKRNKEAEKNMIIYLDKNEVPTNAERIGIIYNTEKDQETAFAQVKALAARTGANALLFVGGKEVTAGQKVFNTLVWPGSFKARWNFIVFQVAQKDNQ